MANDFKALAGQLRNLGSQTPGPDTFASSLPAPSAAASEQSAPGSLPSAEAPTFVEAVKKWERAQPERQGQDVPSEARRGSDDGIERVLEILKEMVEDIRELKIAAKNDGGGAAQEAPGIGKDGKFRPGGPRPMGTTSRGGPRGSDELMRDLTRRQVADQIRRAAGGF